MVEPWDVIAAHGADAFRWYYLTAQQPWAGLPLLGRDGRRIGAPVPAHPLEHLLLLGPLRQRRGPRPADFADASDAMRRRGRARRERPRPLGALAAAGDDRDRARADGRVRLHRRRPGDRRVRRGALQLVRAALAPPLLGRRPGRLRDPAPLPAGDGGAARPVHALPRRRDPPQPRRRRGRASSASCPTRSTCATSPTPTRRSPTPSWRPAMEAVRLTVELGRAARAQAKAKVRQPLRRAVIVANDAERAAIEARADLVTAELNVKELDFVTDEARAGQLRGQAQLPLARPALRQAHAAGRRRGRGARPGPRRRGDGRRRRGRDRDRRRRAHARRRGA